MPDLLFARANGELLDFPGLKMAGRMGDSFVKPARKELIPLPEGASLTALPGRVPVGVDKKTGAFIKLTHNPYRRGKEKVWAVGALLPQGFTRTLIPAFGTSGEQKNLPLLGYTGVGIYQGRLMVAAIQTDEHEPWHPKHYNTRDFAARIRRRQQKFPHNRLLQQLATCSLEYGCFTAQNIFYGRWEGGLPVSPQCNAACIGCISSQPSECCPSPQRRLDFVPSVSEIEEIGADHLKKGKNAIISFGQGCEGEPSLQGGLIAESIKRIRTRTDCGTININTNAGDHGNIKKIISAGLDSMRVSLISPTPEVYDAYHRPGDYGLEQVRSSLIAAADAGVYTSLNLLTFPGFTDDAEEVASLISLIKATGVKKVQFRNLNIDPDQFMALLPAKKYQPMGIPRMIEHLRKEIPHLAIGNFSRSVAR